MSLTREVTVWCDAEGCGQWSHGPGVPKSTVRGARNNVKSEGWTYETIRDLDFCPTCSRERAKAKRP